MKQPSQAPGAIHPKARTRPAAHGAARASPCGNSRHSGQSSVEYAVVCAALAFALGIGMVDDTSVLRQLLGALQSAYRQFAFALSLPT